MEELEKTAKELILAITEKTLKSLKDKGLLKEPSKLQMLCSSPEMKSLIKKLSTPKYDPNRKFKKGDIVEPCKGREVYACEWEDCCFHKMDGKYEVLSDEKEGHVSVIDKETGIDCYVSAFALELVTPVEELEPYSVVDAHTHWDVADKNMKTVATYSKGHHPNAKAAAEAERDRLNAEYRKEQGND